MGAITLTNTTYVIAVNGTESSRLSNINDENEQNNNKIMFVYYVYVYEMF